MFAWPWLHGEGSGGLSPPSWRHYIPRSPTININMTQWLILIELLHINHGLICAPSLPNIAVICLTEPGQYGSMIWNIKSTYKMLKNLWRWNPSALLWVWCNKPFCTLQAIPEKLLHLQVSLTLSSCESSKGHKKFNVELLRDFNVKNISIKFQHGAWHSWGIIVFTKPSDWGLDWKFKKVT